VKKTKLFLEPPDPASGFQAYVFEGLNTHVETPPVVEASTPESSFGLPDAFWQWMESDSELRRQFDRMIGERVAQGLEKRFLALKDQVEKEAHQEGFQKGMAEAAERVQATETKLTTICDEVLRQKSKLMHDHENRWAQAFSHLLRRFLVPGRELALETLRSWLTESLTSFGQTGRVRIHLSAEDYQRLRESLTSIAEKNWEFAADATLNPGEVHCECDGGGILFSEGSELQRLESWIERFGTHLEESIDEP